MPLFLLYFIILTYLHCAETLNIVLSFVTDVHFWFYSLFPLKCDDFHIHLDFVILYAYTEGK
jgi:hypothetical protein